ncbi:MAG: hypothetical protein ABIJ16_03145, partial [Bacteroidota bacterium]
MKRTITVLFAAFIAIGCYSQKKEAKIQFNLTLRDGNYITGTSLIDKVTLETDFGTLIIPIKNVTSVELGITEDKALSPEILKKAKELNSNNLEEAREKLYTDLIQYGIKAIPVLTSYLYSDAFTVNEYNTVYTVEGALRELKAVHNVADNEIAEDVISINYSYKMGGKSSFKNISLKTEYGALEIPREKIQKMDILYIEENDGSYKQFMLMAATHISGNQNGGWLNTGIMVKPGQRINIISNGTVTLASLSNGKYDPDGKANNVDYGYDSTYPTY